MRRGKFAEHIQPFHHHSFVESSLTFISFHLFSLKTKFLEVDTSNLTDTSRGSNLLQRRSLGNLSPGFVEATTKKRTQQPARNIETQSKQEKDKTKNIETPSSGPTRRIRRPTMIRRPKLIGKSVEGAAMQAVAYGRKRASTNQFKNKTSSTTGTARTQLNSDRARARGTTVRKIEPTLARSQNKVQEKKRDDNWVRVVNDFLSLSSATQGKLGLLSFIQSKARLKLADIWWPRSASQIIPKSVAELLVLLSPSAWNNVCALPPLPGGVSDTFIPTLARWIVAIKPGLQILSVSSSSSQPNKRIDSMLLCTEVRNIRGTKCCGITRLSLTESKSTRQRRTLVRSEGWILNLRRRPKASKKNRRQTNAKSSYFTEKDAAGMDKVLADVYVSTTMHHNLRFHRVF